jgi:DNA-directed RNA polymerase subunit L
MVHTAYEILKERLNAFEDYTSCTLSYAHLAENEPIKISEQEVVSLKNQLKKTEQSILKSMSSVLATFHKTFQPRYRK